MSLLHGGRTVYGLELGIVMLDTRFPRLPGDVGHAATWGFPVAYRVVRGAEPRLLARDQPDPALVAPFVQAVRELEGDGVRAVITSCGFLAIFQAELAAAARVPVLSSSLLQVPLAARLLRPGQRVGIITARAVLTERHFRGAGWSSEDVPVVQVAPPADGHFVRTFVDNAPSADAEVLGREVQQVTERLMGDHPDVGAIVLECANFVPFAQAVRGVAGVPVLDLHTLGVTAHLATTGTDFPTAL